MGEGGEGKGAVTSLFSSRRRLRRAGSSLTAAEVEEGVQASAGKALER